MPLSLLISLDGSLHRYCNNSTNSFILELGISVEIDMFLDWFWQVDYPHLGKLCSLVIPGSLTALDHWSPQVKVCPCVNGTKFLLFLLVSKFIF